MDAPIFTGVANEWYKQRLQRLYKEKPKCKYLFSTNHLLGTCPTCGAGKFAANNSKARITQFALDRIYTLIMRNTEDIQRLRHVCSNWQGIYTNLEFPIPTVQVRATQFHTPAFICMSQKLVIDVLRKFNDRTAVITKVEEILVPAGYQYLVLNEQYVEVHRSLQDIHEDMCGRQFVAMMKSMMQRGQS